jgi:hypothetical protein
MAESCFTRLSSPAFTDAVRWKSSFSVRIIFHQPAGWNFRWLLHRPSHFTSVSWWPELP